MLAFEQPHPEDDAPANGGRLGDVLKRVDNEIEREVRTERPKLPPPPRVRDVFDVLIAFNITCHATAEAVKELLSDGDPIRVKHLMDRAIELREESQK